VPRDTVRRAIAGPRPRPAVYALEPHTLGGILSDVKTVGDAVGRQREARALIEGLRARIDAVSLRSAVALMAASPPRVVCLQQSEPPVAAGWWLAELVGLAGGYDVLDGSCQPPRAVTQEQIQAARPDLVLRCDRPPFSASEGGQRCTVTAGPGVVALLEHLAASIVPHAGRKPDLDDV
jgi:iron complex transport system substrate-binding protein